MRPRGSRPDALQSVTVLEALESLAAQHGEAGVPFKDLETTTRSRLNYRALTDALNALVNEGAVRSPPRNYRDRTQAPQRVSVLSWLSRRCDPRPNELNEPDPAQSRRLPKDPTARLSVVLSARGRSGRLRARRIEELFNWAAAALVGQNVKAPARIVRRCANHCQTCRPQISRTRQTGQTCKRVEPLRLRSPDLQAEVARPLQGELEDSPAGSERRGVLLEGQAHGRLQAIKVKVQLV